MAIIQLDEEITQQGPVTTAIPLSSCVGTLTTLVPSAPATASATALLRDLLEDSSKQQLPVSRKNKSKLKYGAWNVYTV